MMQPSTFHIGPIACGRLKCSGRCASCDCPLTTHSICSHYKPAEGPCLCERCQPAIEARVQTIIAEMVARRDTGLVAPLWDVTDDEGSEQRLEEWRVRIARALAEERSATGAGASTKGGS